ncbi:surfeit locus protein 6 isoform X2 [Polypterus senegalus]|uniref:surfeit locus protein 6 isoform X2 n=1 Tax=Polypterus senegalus TaxID=55291 RepID=UPI0019644D44|nr:surfeit locus protein 6 isoform X2 [Polypterus senegalus]
MRTAHVFHGRLPSRAGKLAVVKRTSAFTMNSIAAKDAYFQKLASKVCASQSQEARKRPFVPHKGGTVNKGKKQKKQKPSTNKAADQKKKGFTKKGQRAEPEKAKQEAVQRAEPKGQDGTLKKKPKAEDVQSFSTMDILKQRLHEKMEECRNAGSATKSLSAEELERKRSRRKLERERKKRKRKEMRMKKLLEQKAQTIKEEERKETNAQKSSVPKAEAATAGPMVFNKVEVGDEFVDKVQKKKEKKKKIKGTLTPLTGKNYKQLLSRVEERKAKLEELKSKNSSKAQELEKKMKWTNVLYKAEGLKIKDDEDMLKTALKRKEKKRAQKKQQWEKRSVHVLEKMQQRQDKRKKNIQKQKRGKLEKRKAKAQKRGRVLPGDLDKMK